MEKIKKFLRKIPNEHRRKIMFAIFLLYQGKEESLDIKKLKNEKNVYRLRVGKYRVFFRRIGRLVKVIDARKRDDNTYHHL